MRQAMFVGIVATVTTTLATLLLAQDNRAPDVTAPPLVIGSSGGMTPIVGNLDEAAPFYADLVGLANVPPIRKRSYRDVPYPEVLKNQGTPDATIRQINLNIPGSAWRVEVLEFSDIDSAAVDARIQDPGAVTLVIMVRDIEGLLARLTKRNSQIITPGARPVLLTAGGARARAVVLKAPGGHFVELQQPDPLPVDSTAPTSSVIGGHIRVTVADTDATLRLYRDRLGFQSAVGAFTNESSRLQLMGTTGARFRMTSTSVPGDSRQILEFIEFNNIDRRAVHSRIQDSGSAKIHLRVPDLSAALAAFEGAGGIVATTGGKPMIYTGVPTVIVRDLNNIFMNLQQQTQTRAAPADR
ncbi:MAG: hypothetical protein ABI868_04810 [Acidobacteriota bacterium]